jgi:hypothetical protein
MPGNPNFIVQNMTGGGGLIAANYVYGVANPDGLTLGALGPWIYFDQLAGAKKFNSIGRRSPGSARRNKPARSWS